MATARKGQRALVAIVESNVNEFFLGWQDEKISTEDKDLSRNRNTISYPFDIS